MVYFKEVLPNPAGRDAEGEWVKIINTGAETVNLSGWSLSDKSGKTFSFSILSPKSISPGEEFVLAYSATRISLNNDGDTLFLHDESGNIMDEFTYTGPAADDEILFAAQFAPEEAESVPGVPTLEELALVRNNASFAVAPLFIALILAIVFGAGVGALAKEFIEES